MNKTKHSLLKTSNVHWRNVQQKNHRHSNQNKINRDPSRKYLQRLQSNKLYESNSNSSYKSFVNLTFNLLMLTSLVAPSVQTVNANRKKNEGQSSKPERELDSRPKNYDSRALTHGKNSIYTSPKTTSSSRNVLYDYFYHSKSRFVLPGVKILSPFDLEEKPKVRVVFDELDGYKNLDHQTQDVETSQGKIAFDELYEDENLDHQTQDVETSDDNVFFDELYEDENLDHQTQDVETSDDNVFFDELYEDENLDHQTQDVETSDDNVFFDELYEDENLDHQTQDVETSDDNVFFDELYEDENLDHQTQDVETS